MDYFASVVDKNGNILSCDMLRLRFRFPEYHMKGFNNFLYKKSLGGSLDFHVYESRAYFSYKFMVNITLKNNSSFVLGLGFNGVRKSDFDNCFIEFNPNKCLFQYSPLFDILNYIKPLIPVAGFELVRFDLAIDMPARREDVCLIKDLRSYKKNFYVDLKHNNLGNMTEYLGVRNSNGFVKLYNKTLEQGLNYDLTRLEITLDSFDYSNFKSHIPQVRFYKSLDLYDLYTLNDTDKVLIMLLRESVNSNLYLKMLGRVKREKIEPFMFTSAMLDISEYEFYNLIGKIRPIYS